MTLEESKKGIRTLNFLIGVALVVTAITLLIFSDVTLIVLLLTLSIAVLIIGVTNVITGSRDKTLETKIRVMKVTVGILAMALGVLALILAIINPAASTELLFIILSIALIILGIGRFARGLQAEDFPGWFRALIIAVGVITIIICIVIIFVPPLTNIQLLILLSIVLVFNGIGRIALGIVKEK
ncbi:MAG TPA: DUF308 domain-containing protein [Candidatus Deferrimicrobium sp.]|nr:DUF308 domain-containing protein [Candidatus Deferrimicrobium sp.]